MFEIIAAGLESYTEVMREANLMVDRDDDKLSPRDAAAWLLQAIGVATCPPRCD